MTRYCCTCGCPREATSLEPCQECRDWPFSTVPNPQYEGWLERREAGVTRERATEEE